MLSTIRLGNLENLGKSRTIRNLATGNILMILSVSKTGTEVVNRSSPIVRKGIGKAIVRGWQRLPFIVRLL